MKPLQRHYSSNILKPFLKLFLTKQKRILVYLKNDAFYDYSIFKKKQTKTLAFLTETNFDTLINTTQRPQKINI